jgi:hypothetical protein
MAGTSRERNSRVIGAARLANGQSPGVAERRPAQTNSLEGGSDMTVKDKLVEQSCTLAEIRRLAAHKR